MIPLSQLADIVVEEGPAQISRENIHRRITVEANVRGRDLGSFVADVQQAVASAGDAAAGYYVEYGGQFENLQRASQRLLLVVPVALFLIFVLLYTTFNAVQAGAADLLQHPDRGHRRHRGACSCAACRSASRRRSASSRCSASRC